MNPASIVLNRVTLAFGTGRTAVTAIEDLSLEIPAGEFFSLLGPSGCGKSSLLAAISGFQRPVGGLVLAGGQPVPGPGPDRGIVFQQPTLFPWKTVRANVDFGLKMRGVPRAERREQVEAILDQVGLSAFGAHYPSQLSGGMQQRVGLARVLVNRPRIMLMDEPFCALDALTRLSMQELLLDVWETFRTTVVFVTHDIEEALFLGSRVGVLSARPGRLRALLPVPLGRPRGREVLVGRELVGLRKECLDLLHSRAERPAERGQYSRVPEGAEIL